MRDRIGWAAGLALALATAVSAGPAAAAKARDGASTDPQREVCRSQPVVGSRLKRIRVCMTAQEWDDLKLQEQLGLTRKQISGSVGCGDGGCPIERGGKDTPW